MKIIGESILWSFFTRHPDGRSKARSWYNIVKEANWHNIQELRKQMPSADGGVKGIYTIFNIRQYRIVTKVDYLVELVKIISVFTHDQYMFWSNRK